MTCVMKISDISPAGIDLIKRWESSRLYAYLDGAGIWTIGWGTTVYPSGTRVKQYDKCTQEQADEWLRLDLRWRVKKVDELTVDTLDQKEFDALCCFTYNVGVNGLRSSTLRRLVNTDIENPEIRAAFMAWHKNRDEETHELVPSFGLWRRRHSEADMFYGVATNMPLYPYPR